MIIDDDNFTSGRINPNQTDFYDNSPKFTDHEEIPSSGYNRLVRAVRYGKYFILKGLKPQYANDKLYQSMLQKEFEIMVLMSHPNIIRVYDLEEVDGIGLCIIMEYVDGVPLDQWLASKPSFRLRRRMFLQLLSAMAHWHSHQVVHRDLKPSNILVTRNGNNARIIDFGLADTDLYAVLKEPAFTLSYASPEQLQGGPLDCRSDIYSLGRVMRLIFPHNYGYVAARCCRQRREQRYSSADSVISAIKRRNSFVWVALPIFLFLLTIGWKMKFHYNCDSFSYEVAPGQVLRLQIDDSKVSVLGADSVSGDLVIPKYIRHGLFSYPVYQITRRAFLSCRDISHISFPSTLRRIEDRAFEGCRGLQDTLVLPEGLTFLGDGVFHSCVNLRVCRVNSRRLHLKDDPDKDGRFGHTENMHTIIVDGHVDTICEQLFHWAYWGVHEIYLEEGLVHLGEGSFSELYYLEKIHFPSTLRTIDNNCFYGCGIKRLVLPEGLEVLEDYSLACLFNCKYLEVGPNVRYMGFSALHDCKAMDTILFRGTTPPTIESNTIGIRTDGMHPQILVPKESLDLYLADSNFAILNPKGY